MKKYQNKYRIETCRLQNWDYSNKASYFVTLVTKSRKRHFGTIQNANMQLSSIGILAHKYWLEIPQHFSYIHLDSFIIMPDHIHGIITYRRPIGTSQTFSPSWSSQYEKPSWSSQSNNPNHLSLTKTKSQMQTQAASLKWKPGHLGVILNQYKRIVTIQSRKLEPSFSWQPRYYDRIIRDERAFKNISNYIISNPKNWKG